MKKKLIIIITALLTIALGILLRYMYLKDIKTAAEMYRNTDNIYSEYNRNDAKAVIKIDDSDEAEFVEGSLQENSDDGKNNTRNAKRKAATNESKKDTGVYSYRYDGPWEEQLNVDLKGLIELYPNVRGWLFFENEDISYPIVQGSTDDIYLRTAYNGENTAAGSIFLEAINKSDFSDSHSIIYGHNMRNGTMFGKLRNYVNRPNYYEYHKYFQIVRLDDAGNEVKARYKIFAYGKTKSYAKIFTVCREHDTAFGEVLQYIQGNSRVTTDVPVYQTDNIVTLSTCEMGENRLAISAVKVDEIIVPQN